MCVCVCVYFLLFLSFKRKERRKRKKDGCSTLLLAVCPGCVNTQTPLWLLEHFLAIARASYGNNATTEEHLRFLHVCAIFSTPCSSTPLRLHTRIAQAANGLLLVCQCPSLPNFVLFLLRLLLFLWSKKLAHWTKMACL